MGTGGSYLRTAEISKIHIKSTKMAVQKLSPPIERSRRKEFEKNMKSYPKRSDPRHEFQSLVETGWSFDRIALKIGEGRVI